jgi:hypothetical protein
VSPVTRRFHTDTDDDHRGLATNYHNITHPSLPNYVAATSGLPLSSLQNFLPDCDPSSSCETSAASIFGQGETWKAYAESMPSDCYKSDSGSLVATAEQLLGLPLLGQA